MTTKLWPLILPYIHHSFGPEYSKHYGLFVIPYLDSDTDGKVSVWELYDGMVVEILQSIFDGLDVNGNGVLEKLEAIPENIFRPKFIRNIISEMFKVADRNKDFSLSMDDVPDRFPG